MIHRAFSVFIFDEDNTIRLKNNINLCLTVAKGKSKKGGGGSPIHLIRGLSMQICNKKDSVYQTWVIRHIKKGKIFNEMLFKSYGDFGFKDILVILSTRPENIRGSFLNVQLRVEC